jgi:hypothetical protein
VILTRLRDISFHALPGRMVPLRKR